MYMEILDKCNLVRFKIEKSFYGLPHAHRMIISFLLNKTNVVDGIVSEVTYSTLSSYLAVTRSPGRKQSGTPSKQTIRNYIKSIEREFGDHFKVITEGQQLKFQFPQLPKLLAEALSNTELNTVPDTAETQASIEEFEVLPCELNTEVNTDLNLQPTFESAVKNNINNNKTNKTNLSSTQFSPQAKKSISEDFYPSDETIATAKAMGYHKVTCQDEIRAFIQFNKKNETEWTDFNPVFLRWLERGAVYEQKKQLREQNKSSRSSYVSGSHQRIHSRNTIEEVMALNSGGIHPGTGLPIDLRNQGCGRIIDADIYEEPSPALALEVALAELDELVRTTVYQ